MGIRVHKVIGYGLTDVKTRKRDKYSRDLSDKRFDPDGYMGVDWETKEDTWSFAGYKKFLKKWKKGRPLCESADLDSFTFNCLKSKDKPYYREFPNWEPFSSVIYDSEFGLPHVLVIVPFAFFPKWNRYDNTIDYIEESALYEQRSHVVELNRGIYPYDGRYWDPRRKKLHIFGAEKSGERPLMHHDIDRRLATKTLRHAVPSEIHALAEYLKLFRNPADIHRLKPLLYVYWS